MDKRLHISAKNKTDLLPHERVLHAASAGGVDSTSQGARITAGIVNRIAPQNAMCKRWDTLDWQQQMSRASCLVLILAAIIYWQIREIDTVLRHWDPIEEGIDPALLPHISPIGWDNVILYGEYALDPGWVRHPHGIPQHRVENFA